MAEGKENALAIGQLKMSTAEIRKINKDIGIDLVHFIGDGLYRYRVD
jgi:PUA domain protein